MTDPHNAHTKFQIYGKRYEQQGQQSHEPIGDQRDLASTAQARERLRQMRAGICGTCVSVAFVSLSTVQPQVCTETGVYFQATYTATTGLFDSYKYAVCKCLCLPRN